MGLCINHPERETSYMCMKHGIYLCDECLSCRDEDLYCKYRPSCPIHFMSKKNFESDTPPVREEDDITVTFEPDGIKTRVTPGTNLLEAATAAGVYINASCNGKGSCGKCKLIVESGLSDHQCKSPLLSDREKNKGYILACQAVVTGPCTVRVPEETIEKKLRAAGMGEAAAARLSGLVLEIDPMVKHYDVEMHPPSLDDTMSDLDRIKLALRKEGCDTDRMSTGIRVMRQLTSAVREDTWHVTATILGKKCSCELVSVRPSRQATKHLGMAVDLGTTSIVVYLVDMESGAVLSAASGHNRQAACGDDVINRIVCAEKNGVKKLQKMALATINNLSAQALLPLGEKHDRIDQVVISGNTTMVHLLLGIDARYIRREPYIQTVAEFPILKAGEIGLKAAWYAGVFVMPGPAGYVGGDIVSGILHTGFHREKKLTLFIDVGTNGEIVLGNDEFLMTAACSAGPAFEGGGIRWGMRAESGAIEKINLEPDTLEPEIATVDNHPARGICGSGMIDLLSEMLTRGVIGQDGRFFIGMDHPRMTTLNDDPAFILEYQDQAGVDEDIVFTQSDIRSLILSKAAVYAGFTALLSSIGMDFSMVDRMIITGGFGQYLDVDKAVTIGFLPDIAREKFQYMGNSSIAGAYMALLSDNCRQQAVAIAARMTYVDFSSSGLFMDEFTKAQFLPHTDTRLFPSIKTSRIKA